MPWKHPFVYGQQCIFPHNDCFESCANTLLNQFQLQCFDTQLILDGFGIPQNHGPAVETWRWHAWPRTSRFTRHKPGRNMSKNKNRSCILIVDNYWWPILSRQLHKLITLNPTTALKMLRLLRPSGSLWFHLEPVLNFSRFVLWVSNVSSCHSVNAIQTLVYMLKCTLCTLAN